MGIFSSEKRIYVSSVVYNLSGDELDRPDFLKTVVVGAVLGSRPQTSLGNRITDAQIQGPSMRQRRVYNWAKDNFDAGMPSANLIGGIDLGDFDFDPHIPVNGGETAETLNAALENANYIYWARQHIFVLDPTLIDTNWTADYDNGQNTNFFTPEDPRRVVITYEDQSFEVIDIPDYHPDERYIYVEYTLVTEQGEGEPPLREPRLWIYKIGSGNATLDALDDPSAELPEFMPFIPLRLDNKSITHNDYSDIFEDCKTAYRRATGGHIDDVLESIEDNENISDIDFAYMVYGVPLNTDDRDSRVYLYEFFKQLMPYQTWGEPDYQDWLAWRNARENNTAPHPATSVMQLKSSSALTSSYDMQIHWISITEDTGTGLAKVGAEVGEVWFDTPETMTYNEKYSIGENAGGEEQYRFHLHTFDNISLYHQVAANSWRRLIIRGALHKNNVYATKAIEILAGTALTDPEESGFIVPIHYPTMKRLPLRVANQMATRNALIIFNAYEVVTTRWYEKGIFRILFSLVVAAISAVVFPGAIGLLGSNAAIGAAMGYTGTAALIVGGITNAIAAIALSMVIQIGATAIFGEELGVLISALATFVAFQYVQNFTLSGNWSLDWNGMLRADNLIRLTDSVAGGVAQWARGEISSLQSGMVDITKDYAEQMDEIEKLSKDVLGYGGGTIDPLMFTDIQDPVAPRVEARETFLARTLLTGSDLAEVSLSMVQDFPEISLKLPDYTT